MILVLLRIAFLLREFWIWMIRPVSLGVRIILVQDGEVLLVRHTYMPGWHFPGGSVNSGETTLEAAAREAREEAGVELLEPPTLIGIFATYGGGNSDHVATYLCRRFRRRPATDRWEIAECKSFPLDELPPQLSNLWSKVLRDQKLIDA